MQVKPHQLKRQQAILNVLGYYRGQIDGVWGPETIRSMKNFEASGKFNPGIPNNGLPFNDRGPWPPDIYLNRLGVLVLDGQEAQVERAENSVPVANAESLPTIQVPDTDEIDPMEPDQGIPTPPERGV